MGAVGRGVPFFRWPLGGGCWVALVGSVEVGLGVGDEVVVMLVDMMAVEALARCL